MPYGEGMTKTIAVRFEAQLGRWIVREDGKALSGWATQGDAYASALRVGTGWERDGYTVTMVVG